MVKKYRKPLVVEARKRKAGPHRKKKTKEPLPPELGSDECDDCDGSGTYYIDNEPQACICSEPQE